MEKTYIFIVNSVFTALHFLLSNAFTSGIKPVSYKHGISQNLRNESMADYFFKYTLISNSSDCQQRTPTQSIIHSQM